MIGAESSAIGPTVGLEIERKFLLRQPDGDPVVAGLTGLALLQGYFRDIDGWSVRLRLARAQAGEQAWLTLKSRDKSIMRWEIESPVAPDLAERLLGLLPAERKIEKIRYRRPVDGDAALVWEIDRFLGRHAGLWLAEIELPHADYPVVLPDWLGEDVTADPRYRNAALAHDGAADGAAAPLPDELEQLARRLLATAGAAAAPPEAKHGARHAGREAERRLRQARLERELRANLLRRKQQNRGRDAGVAAPDSGAGLDREEPAQ